jgi:hypothetical protein
VIRRPADQQGAGRAAQRPLIDHDAQRHHGERDGRHRKSVTERDRQQRVQHDPAAVAMQAKRDRKQPAHRRVDAVERAEPGERQPRPGGAHGRGPRLSLATADDPMRRTLAAELLPKRSCAAPLGYMRPAQLLACDGTRFCST